MVTWTFCLATMMLPRPETRRAAITGSAGRPGMRALRAPRRLCRSAGGTGQGMVRSMVPVAWMRVISGPFMRKRDALPGELGANVELGTGQAGQATAVDHPVHLDHRRSR